MPINIVCVVWIVCAIVIFCMPVAIPVTSSSMNYASVVFLGFGAIALMWYFVYARRNFHGPPVLREDFAAAVDESPEVSEKSS